MSQFAIMRFAKYKGPEISRIETHNERKKEKYASNPDVDITRSKYNFHIVEPGGRYRQEAERQIREANARTRKDSVRLVEMLVTATDTFFEGKSRKQIREYFQRAVEFIAQHQSSETILSAVVHMDEKTPHMHLCFVPLTEDGRLSAKDIIGNRKRLSLWQDDFWEYMAGKYPELERGESAAETGRTHIPTQIFKEMSKLNRQKAHIETLIAEIGPFNTKAKTSEVIRELDSYIPKVSRLNERVKKYSKACAAMEKENEALTAENRQLEEKSRESIHARMERIRIEKENEELQSLFEKIPPEIIAEYSGKNKYNEIGVEL